MANSSGQIQHSKRSSIAKLSNSDRNWRKTIKLILPPRCLAIGQRGMRGLRVCRVSVLHPSTMMLRPKQEGKRWEIKEHKEEHWQTNKIHREGQIIMHSLKRRGEPRLHEPLSGSFQQAASPCRGPTNFPQLRYRHGLARALATKKKNEKTRKRKKMKKKKKKQIIIKL